MSEDNEARYRFLLDLLIDRGVIYRYQNQTWVLRGIYGVDNSGLRGAGPTIAQCLDNAIEAARVLK
jgi:hypothetical protein